jgi:para-nitrobenzyl esterase
MTITGLSRIPARPHNGHRRYRRVAPPAFGGDPAQVTIAGQSAGGGACAALLGVPAARGLFRGAAGLSGGTALQQTPDGVRAVAGLMAGHLGVTSLDQAALEAMPAEQILAAQGAVAATVMGGSRDGEAVAALLSDGLTLPWAPWTDGEVVTAAPLEAAARQHDMALLAGATAHEFNAAWMTADWVTTAMVTEALVQARVPAGAAAAYLDQAGSRPGAAVGQALTDRTFRVPAQVLAEARAAAGGPGSTTSAGPHQLGRWPGWPSTAWTCRSSSTRWTSRA